MSRPSGELLSCILTKEDGTPYNAKDLTGVTISKEIVADINFITKKRKYRTITITDGVITNIGIIGLWV